MQICERMKNCISYCWLGCIESQVNLRKKSANICGLPDKRKRTTHTNHTFAIIIIIGHVIHLLCISMIDRRAEATRKCVYLDGNMFQSFFVCAYIRILAMRMQRWGLSVTGQTFIWSTTNARWNLRSFVFLLRSLACEWVCAEWTKRRGCNRRDGATAVRSKCLPIFEW